MSPRLISVFSGMTTVAVRSNALLVICRNVICNRPSNHPLGIEHGSACLTNHAACTPVLTSPGENGLVHLVLRLRNNET
jgi:hypothetical protein